MLLVFVLAALGLSPAQAVGFLHRSHTQIVDGAERAVRLRGVNLGNWLYIEPWMIGNTHFGMYGGEDGKPDEMPTAITALVGPARTAAFYQSWRDNYITRADIRKIAGWGFNSVRVPLDYRLFADPATGKDVNTGFVYLDRLLLWCAEAKVYVIPDMHDVPGGKLGWIAGNVYGDAQKQIFLTHVWRRIAGRYKDNPWIGGYDLVNEPAVYDPPKLGALYKTLIGAVRAVDTNHLLIVEGDAWGSRLDLLGLAGPTDVWDDNLALSLHVYGSPLAPSPLAGPEQIAAKLDIPLWMGEFGYNSNTWDNALRGQAEAGGVGWCLWAYKSSGIWSLTGCAVPPAYGRLLDYWNSEKRAPNTPRPAPGAAWQTLKTLAQGTLLERCTVHKDVLDALDRPGFATRAVPYRQGLTIPGRIPAVWYDMGAEGVASHDTVASDQAGKGPAGEAWNSGWNFRNDGVDIFAHPDPGGLGDVIGGIASGEWTDYTVTVTPGTDTLQIRYASPIGGKMRVLLDGATLSAPLTLRATGGYDRFQTLTVPSVKIRKTGRATLRCAFDSDGFSLNWIAFVSSARPPK